MRFKFCLILTIYLAFSFKSRAQTTKETDRIYLIALEKYTDQVDSFYTSNTKPSDKKIIYIEQPTFISNIPNTINGHKIILLTDINRQQILKEHDRLLTYTIIRPMSISGDQLSINIAPYYPLKQGNNIIPTASDGLYITFKFDCDKKEFEYLKTVEWKH